MPILREKKVWRKEIKRRSQTLINRLPAEQSENVMRALEFLRARHGSAERIAKLMGIHENTLTAIMRGKSGKPSAGLAVRVAHLADVSVDDVLNGTYPKKGACPMCGRC